VSLPTRAGDGGEVETTTRLQIEKTWCGTAAHFAPASERDLEASVDGEPVPQPPGDRTEMVFVPQAPGATW